MRMPTLEDHDSLRTWLKYWLEGEDAAKNRFERWRHYRRHDEFTVGESHGCYVIFEKTNMCPMPPPVWFCKSKLESEQQQYLEEHKVHEITKTQTQCRNSVLASDIINAVRKLQGATQMADSEIESMVRTGIAKGSHTLTEFLLDTLHFDFRRLDKIVQQECGTADTAAQDETNSADDAEYCFKPFMLSRPKEEGFATSEHFWAVRHSVFTGQDDCTYWVRSLMLGGGYQDLPEDGRVWTLEVHKVIDFETQERIELACLKDVKQPLTDTECDSLLREIQKELGIQTDSAEVEKIEEQYNLTK